MKTMKIGLLTACLLFTGFLSLIQAQEAEGPAKAQALIDKGGVENCRQAYDICMAAVQKDPGGFEANWMAAQACREYGLAVKKSEAEGWEDVCKEYGKKGMEFAEKAIAIDAAKPQGHYWYGTSVGIYSDGVSILKAIKEGLKDKTQKSFETVYKIDKTYDKAGVVGALGRFWQVLPWPLRDKEKSLAYFREYQATPYYKDPDTVEIRVYLAELLMEDKKTREEAKTLLNEAVNITTASKDAYWNKQAKALLSKL